VHGVDLIGWHATPERVDSRIVLGVDGTSFGELANPEALVAGGRFLLERGATAIALVTRMPEAPEEAVDAYLRGHGPDPIGGLEAILSHVLTLALQVPCAHAPYEPPEFVGRVDPRAAAESVGYTYLPCVLQGLAKAPDLAWSTDRASGPDRFPPWMGGDVQHGWVGFDQVGAVVAPWGACGGLPMFAAQAAGIPLIAVRDNLVATSADPRSLGFTNVIEVESYLAAAGALLALREGVAIAALQRPLAPLPCLSAVEASTTA